MSSLITQLKNEHAEIVAILNKIKNLGVTSEKGQKCLVAAKNFFLNHLEKEDTQMYPLLYSKAKNDADLKLLLQRFAGEMNNITQEVEAFFDKYVDGGSGETFANDYAQLMSMLTSRMRREEEILYRKYEASLAKAS